MPPEPPLLPLSRLYRVLGLREGASRAELLQAGRLLRDALERRQRGSALAQPAEGASEDPQALEQEQRALERSLEHWTAPPSPAHAEGRRSRRSSRDAGRGQAPRIGWLLALLLFSLGVVLASLWMMGSLARGPRTESAAAEASTSGRLIVESRPRGGQLRIRIPESDELLWKIPAEGVRLEIQQGRYELEVTREDCPDAWSQTVEIVAGETRHFEPQLCRGEARLVVRSNVAEDRLRIDGYDYGATGTEPHVLPVGDHTIRVDKEGYAPFEGKVRLAPDEELEVRAVLTPIGDQAARRGRPLPVQRQAPTPPPRSDVLNEAAADRATAPPLDLDLALPPLARPDRLLFLEDGRGNRPRGGSTTWHDAVSRLMVGRFDTDGSGRIDRVEESEAIPCEIWQEVERDFDEGGLGLSLSRNYGFDGSEWIEGALGFSREIRSAAYARMQACGLDP
jgi:hypothetical protein